MPDQPPSTHAHRPCTGRVLLIIYTQPEWHPTLAFTSQILSENGIEVDIVTLPLTAAALETDSQPSQVSAQIRGMTLEGP